MNRTTARIFPVLVALLPVSLCAGSGLSEASFEPGTEPRPVVVSNALRWERIEPVETRGTHGVRFAAAGVGVPVAFTDEGMLLPGVRADRRDVASTQEGGAGLSVLIDGADPETSVVAGVRLPGYSNYLLGSDRTLWRTHVPHYESVSYPLVGPGRVDVHISEGRLTCAVTGRSEIRMRIEGSDRTSLADDGAVIILSGDVELRLEPAGNGTVGKAGDRAHFEVEQDGVIVASSGVGASEFPVAVFSADLGGPGYDQLEDMAIDASGAAFVTGYTQSADFPLVNPIDATFGPTEEAFVAKFDSTGDTLVFATYLGGSSQDTGGVIEVDGLGTAYVAGYTSSDDFPRPNVLDIAPGGGGDVFVSRLSVDGSQLLYSTTLGGATGQDFVNGMAIGSDGAIYLAGEALSPDFPLVNAVDPIRGDFAEGFIAKIAPSGTTLAYSSYLGGSTMSCNCSEIVRGVTVDAEGNAYYCGFTPSPDFPLVAPLDNTLDGIGDGFVVKVSASGTSILFSTFIGGSSGDALNTVKIGPGGTIYLAGSSESVDYPTVNAIDSTHGGEGDWVVTKLNASGSAIVYSTYFGNSAYEAATDIAVDSKGAAFVTGHWGGSSGGGFLKKIAPSGDVLDFDVFVNSGFANAVAIDGSGGAYLAGNKFGAGANLNCWVSKIQVPAALSSDSVGVYDPVTGGWFLKNTNVAGSADVVVGFGPAGLGWLALRGDWNGDGTDTLGLYDSTNGYFFLRDSNTPGSANVVAGYGPAGLGWRPVTGDWNGDGVDTIGLYDPSTGSFFLKNDNSPGAADIVFGYGPGGLGWQPIAGDWDSDGFDSVGLYDPSTGFFFLKNGNAPGPADVVVGFGPAGLGWQPLAGDWDGDGSDTVGLYAPPSGFFFLRNTLAPGPADLAFGYGPAGLIPVVGDWNNQ